jgi:hypothetical protein
MGVDEAGDHDPAPAVQSLPRPIAVRGVVDGYQLPVGDVDVTVRDVADGLVDGDHVGPCDAVRTSFRETSVEDRLRRDCRF